MDSNDQIYKMVEKVLRGEGESSIDEKELPQNINQELEECMKLGYKIAQEIDNEDMKKEQFEEINLKLDNIMKQVSELSDNLNMLMNTMNVKTKSPKETGAIKEIVIDCDNLS